MRILTLAVSGLLVASSLSAQYGQFAVPSPNEHQFGGGGNAAPFGRTKLFFQSWYRGDMMPGTAAIQAVGVRPRETFATSSRMINMEITLGNSNATFTTLSKTFASNFVGTPAPFVKLKKVSLPALTNPNPVDRPAMWIPGDQPFVYRGPHFLVQWDIQDASTPGSASWSADAISIASAWTGDAKLPNCGGKLTTSYASGTWTATLTGALPNSPVSFLVGIDNQRLGSVPLPLDLAIIGMPKCRLDVAPVAFLPANANASGSATLSAAYTAPAGTSQFLHTQVFHLDTGGRRMSNSSSAIFGRSGLCNYLYNWTVFGPTAQYGPYTTHRSPVVFVR